MRSILVAALMLTASVADAQTAATITGTVTDSVTAAPLASSGGSVFAVGLYSSSGQLLSSWPTNGSGVYQMSGIDPGTYFLKITSSPGYVPELHNNIVCIAADCPVTSGAPLTLTAGANPTIDFALARAGGSSGAVRKSNNDPLAGLRIEVYNISTSFVKSVVAGAGGMYSVDGLAEGVYFARVLPGDSFKPTDVLYELYPNVYCPPAPPTPGSGCRIASGTPITVVVGSMALGIDFALDPAGAISGTVVAEAGGSPINIARVLAFAGDVLIGQATTNPSGQYTIEGLPPGNYRVRTSVTGNYIDEWHNNPCVGCPGTPAAVGVASGGNVGGIDFSLGSGGIITGTITCPSGLAFPGVVFPDVYAYNAAGTLIRKWSNAGESCREGFSSASYTLEGLPAGQYFLLARDVPFSPGEPFGFPRPSGGAFVDHLYGGTTCVTTDCDVRRAVPVNVPAAGITAGVDFTAAFGAGSELIPEVSPPVRMFDARGVELESVRALRAGVVSPGQYITGVPPGVYYARKGDQINGGTVCPDCPPTSGTPIVIRPGQTTFSLTFSTTTSGHRISGNVCAANGSGPLSTITVQVYTDSAVLAGSAATDVLGNYSIAALRPGTYFLRTLNDRGFVDEIYPDVGCASCDVRTGTPVVVAASDVAGIDFALSIGGYVQARVMDSARIPLGGVPVSVFTTSRVLAGRGISNPDGIVRVNLPTGFYYALAEPTAAHGGEVFSERPCTSSTCDVSTGPSGPPNAVPIDPACRSTSRWRGAAR